jgi:hypothetical protein
MVAADASLANMQPALAVDGCWKRMYRMGQASMVMYRKRNGSIGVDAHLHDVDTAERQACLDAALHELKTWRLVDTDSILRRYQAEDTHWNDLDVGFANYLRCDPTGHKLEKESLVTALHETEHQLSSGGCLFRAREGKMACFNIPNGMPKRSLGKLNEFPTTNPQQQEGARLFQEIYLVRFDESPLLLLDELNAYVVTTRGYTAFLRKDGVPGFFEADGNTRSGVLLPMVMLWTTQYFERLGKQYPESAKAFWGNPGNRDGVRGLLAEAEEAYREWLAQLQRVNKEQKELEANCWKMYLATAAHPLP